MCSWCFHLLFPKTPLLGSGSSQCHVHASMCLRIVRQNIGHGRPICRIGQSRMKRFSSYLQIYIKNRIFTSGCLKKNKVSVYLCGKFASLVSIVVYKILPESVKTWVKRDEEIFISEDYPFPSDYSHLSEDLPKKNPGPCLNRSSSHLL